MVSRPWMVNSTSVCSLTEGNETLTAWMTKAMVGYLSAARAFIISLSLPSSPVLRLATLTVSWPLTPSLRFRGLAWNSPETSRPRPLNAPGAKSTSTETKHRLDTVTHRGVSARAGEAERQAIARHRSARVHAMRVG